MYLSEMQKLDRQYVAHTYNRFSTGLQSGDGAVATDVNGGQLIDFSSGIGVNALGFRNAAWVEAVKAQLDHIAHTSNLYYTEPMLRLAKALCERTGMERVFFANSGTEANEGAIKTARRYGENKNKDCYEIICLHGSFHGRTLGALAATGQDSYHAHFGPFPPGFVFAQPNDLASVEALISEKTCAIMLECILGEGGVVPLEADFLRGVAALCKQRDILLVADEIQTGVGRTGKFLCASHFGVQPDIVTLAKGLGGGLPIGAILFGEKVRDTLQPGDHGTTFGANPVVCAGALAVLATIDGKFLDAVADKGAYLQEKLQALPGVTGVTGRGLMLGISLAAPLAASDVAAACLKEGLIVLTAKEKVRLLPPLTIQRNELEAGVEILGRVLKSLLKAAEEAEKETKS